MQLFQAPSHRLGGDVKGAGQIHQATGREFPLFLTQVPIPRAHRRGGHQEDAGKQISEILITDSVAAFDRSRYPITPLRAASDPRRTSQVPAVRLRALERVVHWMNTVNLFVEIFLATQVVMPVADRIPRRRLPSTGQGPIVGSPRPPAEAFHPGPSTARDLSDRSRGVAPKILPALRRQDANPWVRARPPAPCDRARPHAGKWSTIYP